MTRHNQLVLPVLAACVLAIACNSTTTQDVGITGTLTVATGVTAPVTYSNGVGSGFHMAGTLGEFAIADNASGIWQCLAPIPGFPFYEFQATDNEITYDFEVHIATASWMALGTAHAGTLAIDNTNVTLGVALLQAGALGYATSGTLVVTTADLAADVKGSNCGFHVQNVALQGFVQR